MPCPAGAVVARRETAGGQSGRGGRCCRRAGWGRGVATPRAHPSATTANRRDLARQAERPAALPCRPKRQRRGRGAEAGVWARCNRFWTVGNAARAENAAAPMAGKRAAPFDADDHQHRDVFEVIGFPFGVLFDHRVVVTPCARSACRSTSPAGRCAPAGVGRRDRGPPRTATCGFSAIGRRVAGQLEEAEDGLVVDGIIEEAAARGLRSHERRDVLERVSHVFRSWPAAGPLGPRLAARRDTRLPTLAHAVEAAFDVVPLDSLRHNAG